jgi:hypothetical protein
VFINTATVPQLCIVRYRLPSEPALLVDVLDDDDVRYRCCTAVIPPMLPALGLISLIEPGEHFVLTQQRWGRLSRRHPGCLCLCGRCRATPAAVALLRPPPSTQLVEPTVPLDVTLYRCLQAHV